MKTLWYIVAGAGLLPAFIAHAAPAHAQHASRSLVTTINMSADTRAFNMAPSGSEAPPGWTTVAFDDSAWDHVVENKVYGCGGPSWQGGRRYWGPNAGEKYLFRQTFIVPKAKSYYGSELDYAVSGWFSLLALNGTSLIGKPPLQYGGSGRVAIVHNLHPGTNIVTAIGESMPGTLNGCDYLDDRIVLRMTGVQEPLHSSSRSVSLSWQKVRGAAHYYLQLWLVKPTSARIGALASAPNIAVETTGTSTTINTAALSPGTYQWRTAAVNASGLLISGWTQERTITLT